MTSSSTYWDALAPHHSTIENNCLDLPSVRRIIPDLRRPVLIVGAGHGLIAAELLRNGIPSDGVDLSFEMIRHARLRRGLTFVRADARALPFGDGTYNTIIYATGVVDFIGDDDQIKLIINEARRAIDHSGTIFIAFYRFSAASEDFLARLGLLQNNVLSFRETHEIYRLDPLQAIAWVAAKAHTSYLRAFILSLRSFALSTFKEKRATFRMQKIYSKIDDADTFINAVPEKQPYRNAPEIRDLFKRLAVPIKKLESTPSCFIVQI